ncbi:Zn-dependent alcohol dehydrogenase [Citricoccus sp. GCM10030269]|uniref:Zn-dependent alcohol dehydrogenase n=1 Tax=Citricoccus sp. GCM10030269 TaxID=3273388 RepID=UPI00361E66EB
MKAAITPAVGEKFVVRDDVVLDEPGPQEVLVQVRASSLCHSDISVAEDSVGFPMPALLGHEIAGDVVAVGARVRDFAVGDPVVACGITVCGHCTACRSGRPYQCEFPHEVGRAPEDGPRVRTDEGELFQFMGIGGFAEQVLVHENQLVAVSPDIPYDKACLLGCGVVTGAGAAINTAQVRPGQTVAVIGCGGVGLNVIQGAAMAGARRIVAVDLQPVKLELARAFGATDVVNPAETDPVEAVRDVTGGGVNSAFEVIGLTGTAVQALNMCRTGGTAYLIGVQKPAAKLDFQIFEDLILPQKGLRGVSMGSTNPRVDIPYYAESYLQGRLMLDELVSQHIRLDEVNDAYDLLKEGAVARSVITAF